MSGPKTSLFLLVGGIVLIILTWSFVNPKINETFEAKKQLESDKGKLLRLQNKLAELEGLNEVELLETTKVSLRAISTEKNFMEALDTIGQVANEKGLAIESFSVNPGELSVSEKGEISYKLTVVGPLDGVSSFMSEINNTLPLISLVGNLSLNISEGESTTIDLQAENYFLPPPKTIGKTDSPVPKLSAAEEKALSSISSFTFFPQESFPSAGGGKEDPFSF